MSNNRIFYATQSINLQPVSTGAARPLDYRDPNSYVTYSGWLQPFGLQSAGISTTFNSEPVSQLGTLTIYSQVETSPEVEVTLSKVIDGTAPLYTMCTAKATSNSLESINKDLSEISNNMVNVRIAVAPDVNSKATGVIPYSTICERMFLSSVSYTLPVEGNATEQVTLVGSSKKWSSTQITIPTGALNYPTKLTSIVKRQNIAIPSGTIAGRATTTRVNDKITVFPTTSIIPSGIHKLYVTLDGKGTPKIQNITISANLAKENINELGFFGPYYKYTTFPVEVTSEFELISISGDMVDANDFVVRDNNNVDREDFDCSTDYSNTLNEEIVIKICGDTAGDSLYLDLGKKNKLTSVNYTGGDAGGGNATVTYSYQTFNKLNVIPSGSYANTLKVENSQTVTIS
jgi:hypothetical protein